MADDYGMQGLSGNQIVDDIMAQFKKRLQGDCNLRAFDNYSRGYSAKITFHLDLYGLDVTAVDGEFDAGSAQTDTDAEVVDGVLDVEQDEDVQGIKDRLSGELPDSEEESAEPISGDAVRAKRKYTRKLQLASPGVIGGAEEFKE